MLIDGSLSLDKAQLRSFTAVVDLHKVMSAAQFLHIQAMAIFAFRDADRGITHRLAGQVVDRYVRSSGSAGGELNVHVILSRVWRDHRT